MALGLTMQDWLVYLIPTVFLAIGCNMPTRILGRVVLGIGIIFSLYAVYWTFSGTQESYLYALGLLQ